MLVRSFPRLNGGRARRCLEALELERDRSRTPWLPFPRRPLRFSSTFTLSQAHSLRRTLPAHLHNSLHSRPYHLRLPATMAFSTWALVHTLLVAIATGTALLTFVLACAYTAKLQSTFEWYDPAGAELIAASVILLLSLPVL